MKANLTDSLANHVNRAVSWLNATRALPPEHPVHQAALGLLKAAPMYAVAEAMGMLAEIHGRVEYCGHVIAWCADNDAFPWVINDSYGCTTFADAAHGVLVWVAECHETDDAEG